MPVHSSCTELCDKVNIAYADCLTVLSLVAADRLHTIFIYIYIKLDLESRRIVLYLFFIDHLSVCARASLIQLLAIEVFSSSWGRNDGQNCSWMQCVFWQQCNILVKNVILDLVHCHSLSKPHVFWKSVLLHVRTLLLVVVSYYLLINIVRICCCVASKHVLMSFHLIHTSDMIIHIKTWNIHSFHYHVQNAMIPCCSQELLPFLTIMYPFLPPFSTNKCSILPHFLLPSISWSTSQPRCFQKTYAYTKIPFLIVATIIQNLSILTAIVSHCYILQIFPSLHSCTNYLINRPTQKLSIVNFLGTVASWGSQKEGRYWGLYNQLD